MGLPTPQKIRSFYKLQETPVVWFLIISTFTFSIMNEIRGSSFCETNEFQGPGGSLIIIHPGIGDSELGHHHF